MTRRLIGTVPAIVLAGCIVQVEFDPVGSAASIQGSWTIDGAAPTAESCTAAEVRFVRIRFFFEGDTHRDHAGLVFECLVGSFDTRPDLLIGAGEWELAPVAIRADGSEVVTGARQMADAGASAGHIVVAPFDFPGGSG